MKTILVIAAILSLGTACAHADCKSELEAVMQAHLKAGPYHTSMEMVSGGKTRKIESDVILPSSFHMKMPQMETIMLKQGTWMKRGTKWMAMPAAMSAMTGNMMQDAMSKGLTGASNFQCDSQDNFDGQSYPVYQFDTSSAVMGTKVKSHVTLFKGANGLPVGIIVDGTAMGVHSVTTQHITYDPSITISPPQ